MTEHVGQDPVSHRDEHSEEERSGVSLTRCGIGGVLMGLANLVPGVSGGTMILIVGLYDAFISSVADATRLRFTRRGVTVLGVIGTCAVITVVSLAGPLATLVRSHPVAMYALFIGMTLGGVPLLWRMVRPLRRGSTIAMAAGAVLMLGIAASSPERAHPSDDHESRVERDGQQAPFKLRKAYGLDIAAGVLGMSAMVLPGISGAYILLLLGRYEQILGAISCAKDSVLSLGASGDPGAFHIIVPVALGALVSLAGLTNLLKWFLHYHEKPTIGLLLGILTGSVVTLWQLMDISAPRQYAEAGILLVAGGALTLGIAHVAARRERRP